MKNLILGIAVLGLAIACKNTDNTSISDSSTAAAPAGAEAGCDMASGECDMEGKAGCDMEAKAGCDMEEGAGCDMGAKSEQVCPMTGEVMEN